LTPSALLSIASSVEASYDVILFDGSNIGYSVYASISISLLTFVNLMLSSWPYSITYVPFSAGIMGLMTPTNKPTFPIDTNSFAVAREVTVMDDLISYSLFLESLPP